MPDLALVLQVGDDLRLARQGPHEASAVRRGELLGRTNADVRLVDVRGRVVHQVHQQLHELVHDVLVFVVVGYFEGVVEENVGWRRNSYESIITSDQDVCRLKKMSKHTT